MRTETPLAIFALVQGSVGVSVALSKDDRDFIKVMLLARSESSTIPKRDLGGTRFLLNETKKNPECEYR